MGARVEPIYIEQGATWSYGFTLYHPELDVDGNVVYELDDDDEFVLDDEGNKIPVAGDPVDLEGCLGRMQIRKSITSEDFLVFATSEDFDEDDAPHGGRIFLNSGGDTGRIDFILTDQDTDAVTTGGDPGSLEEDIEQVAGVYDFEIEFPIQVGELRARVERVLEGPVFNTRNVTKEVA